VTCPPDLPSTASLIERGSGEGVSMTPTIGSTS
jgi:hypothetical protein